MDLFRIVESKLCDGIDAAITDGAGRTWVLLSRTNEWRLLPSDPLEVVIDGNRVRVNITADMLHDPNIVTIKL